MKGDIKKEGRKEGRKELYVRKKGINERKRKGGK